jgi:hypothetical protein
VPLAQIVAILIGGICDLTTQETHPKGFREYSYQHSSENIQKMSFNIKCVPNGRQMLYDARRLAITSQNKPQSMDGLTISKSLPLLEIVKTLTPCINKKLI